MASASDGTQPRLPVETIHKIATWMMIGGAILMMINAKGILTVATGEIGATALLLGIWIVFYVGETSTQNPSPKRPPTT